MVLGPGGYITKPHGELHAMWNAGSVPARHRRVPDYVALAESYGLQFGDPDWMPDVISRYGLTPPAW